VSALRIQKLEHLLATIQSRKGEPGLRLVFSHEMAPAPRPSGPTAAPVTGLPPSTRDFGEPEESTRDLVADRVVTRPMPTPGEDIVFDDEHAAADVEFVRSPMTQPTPTQAQPEPEGRERAFQAATAEPITQPRPPVSPQPDDFIEDEITDVSVAQQLPKDPDAITTKRQAKDTRVSAAADGVVPVAIEPQILPATKVAELIGDIEKHPVATFGDAIDASLALLIH
jgi:hypothetical protein